MLVKGATAHKCGKIAHVLVYGVYAFHNSSLDILQVFSYQTIPEYALDESQILIKTDTNAPRVQWMWWE